MNCRILRLAEVEREKEKEKEKERETKIERCEGDGEKFERQSYQVEKKKA